MVTVTLDDAQNRLGELLRTVAAGEEVLICQNDIPLGRIVSAAGVADAPRGLRQPGRFAGGVHMSKDFDAPLDDFSDYNN